MKSLVHWQERELNYLYCNQGHVAGVEIIINIGSERSSFKLANYSMNILLVIFFVVFKTTILFIAYDESEWI